MGEHERLINSLETKTKRLDEENRQLEYRSQHELESYKTTSKSEIENLSGQCAKYKAELLELTTFAAHKVCFTLFFLIDAGGNGTKDCYI